MEYKFDFFNELIYNISVEGGIIKMQKKTLKATQIFFYLNKKGLCDQVHIYKGEIVFYHWNKVGSQLIQSLIVKNGKIHSLGYPRNVIPEMFRRINMEVVDNFDLKEHKFVKVLKYE